MKFEQVHDREISKLSILKLTSIKQPQTKKKAKFLSKKSRTSVWVPTLMILLVWTNFALQFQSLWEHFNWSCCVITFNSELSSKVGWCVEHELNFHDLFTFCDTHLGISWLIVITCFLFPKNARERFSFHALGIFYTLRIFLPCEIFYSLRMFWPFGICYKLRIFWTFEIFYTPKILWPSGIFYILRILWTFGTFCTVRIIYTPFEIFYTSRIIWPFGIFYILRILRTIKYSTHPRHSNHSKHFTHSEYSADS